MQFLQSFLYIKIILYYVILHLCDLYCVSFGLTCLAPRPNVYVHCCPLHVNIEQKTLIWMAEFVRTVLGTIDTSLATSVKDNFMSYLVRCLCGTS